MSSQRWGAGRSITDPDVGQDVLDRMYEAEDARPPQERFDEMPFCSRCGKPCSPHSFARREFCGSCLDAILPDKRDYWKVWDQIVNAERKIMNETILKACADYHRVRAEDNGRFVSGPGYDASHHINRAKLHTSWCAEIEAAIAELRKDKPF